MRKPFVLLMVVASSSPCTAAVIHVPADQPTIQAGIDAAADGDEVVIADGLYSGAGNFDIAIAGKSVIVRSANGPDECIIDCLEQGRGFIVTDSRQPGAVLDGLTIRHARALTPLDVDLGFLFGGGAIILSVHSSPTIRNCVLEDNFGSAAAVAHDPFLSQFQPMRVESSTIRNNSGGFFADTARIVAEDCVFAGNGSSFSVSISGFMDIHQSKITGNQRLVSASEGGVQFNQCLITDNHAVNAPLFSLLSGVSFINCTVAYNSASGPGSAIFAWAGFAGVTFRNSIFQFNQGTPTLYSLGSPDIFSLSVQAFHSNIQGNLPISFPVPSSIDADPQFVNPAQGVYRLKLTSPCIDAGSNALVPVSLATDLDGYPRILDGDIPPDGVATVDMGCYELVRSRKQLP